MKGPDRKLFAYQSFLHTTHFGMTGVKSNRTNTRASYQCMAGKKHMNKRSLANGRAQVQSVRTNDSLSVTSVYS